MMVLRQDIHRVQEAPRRGVQKGANGDPQEEEERLQEEAHRRAQEECLQDLSPLPVYWSQRKRAPVPIFADDHDSTNAAWS